MRLLAIEAAGQAISAAVVEMADDGGTLVVASDRIDGAGTSDRLIQLVGALPPLQGAGFAVVDMIAVDQGPGGFTAVRAAVTAARGLALALDRPVLPLTAFEVIASLALGTAGETVVAAIDTRRGTVLVQAFDADLQPLAAAEEVPPDTALRGLDPLVRVAGSGRDLVLAASPWAKGVDAIPDAAAVGLLATRRLRAGLAPPPPFTVEPLYLRPPDARPPRRLIERPDAASPDHAGSQA